MNLSLKFTIRKRENCKSRFWEQKRKRNCKSWLWKRMGILMPPYTLTNFEIQKYYQNEPRFNSVYSRHNLPKKSKGWGIHNKPWWICRHWICTHWIALFCNRSEIVYLITSVLNMFLKKSKNLSGKKT